MIVVRKANRAFSLIEVTLALGVAGFCLIALFGLLPTAINSNQTSSNETAATNILDAVVSDLQQTPNPPPKGSAQISNVFGINVPASFAGPSSSSATATVNNQYIGEDGQPGTDPSTARFLLSAWATPGNGRGATIVRLMITWPAGASLANAQGSVETVVALDRN